MVHLCDTCVHRRAPSEPGRTNDCALPWPRLGQPSAPVWQCSGFVSRYPTPAETPARSEI